MADQPVDPQYRARLQALGDKYAAGIPAALARISAALSHCRNANADPEKLEELHALLHGVAGSAATFGFAMYGSQARRLEQKLLPLLGKRPAESAEWPTLAAEVETYLAWAARDVRASTYNN
jgi:HPt (histidine-containing phosphotransfer) domain-containing protein